MKIGPLLIGPIGLLLVACNREQAETDLPAKSDRSNSAASTLSAPSNSPVHLLKQLSSLPADAQTLTLEEHIYEIPDEQLGLAVESILQHQEPALKRSLLATLYEETQLRPQIIRLPLLLEIARQAEVDPGLRTTIMAELGQQLQTEHGSSWADWALALEEHLAKTEGLLRVE